jgi:uncharacterized membrane protein
MATPTATPIPSLWRTELLHPPVVHFTVALLAVAAGLRALALIPALDRRFPFLRNTARLNLLLGVVAAWASLWTGEGAEDVVNRLICDPTATHRHSEWAEWTTYVATAALVGELVSLRLRRWAWVAAALGISAGALVLMTGHKGAELVFQQGAGVYRPSPGCQEFE